MSAETYARLREQFRLDAPLHERYARWVGDLVRLDLGRSFHDGQRVTSKIGQRALPTLVLTALSLVLSMIVAIPLGVHAAMRAGGWFDRLLAGACLGLYAVPQYVLGILLITVVSVQLGWLPFVGLRSEAYSSFSAAGKVCDLIEHGALIAVCFAYPLIAYQVRFVRATVLDVLGEDYIRTAWAKGAGELRVAYRHALRNAILPLLTLMGLVLPAVLGGSVILEVMFSWPGMGRLLFESILRRDYPVVMALTALSAVVVLLGTLAVDLLYAVADPRIRYA